MQQSTEYTTIATNDIEPKNNNNNEQETCTVHNGANG